MIIELITQLVLASARRRVMVWEGMRALGCDPATAVKWLDPKLARQRYQAAHRLIWWAYDTEYYDP